MAVQTSSEKRWKNTFAPSIGNEYFTPDTLFGAVRYGRIRMSKLPPDAQAAVRKMADEVYRK